MKRLARFVVMIGAAALFVGCGGSQSPVGAPSASTAAPLIPPSVTYGVLYSFKGHRSPDGGHPATALIQGNGTFYGTTSVVRFGNHGTVFAITTSGIETVLHRFNCRGGKCVPKKGGAPTYLIEVGGTLFGTTAAGGSYGFGTVFSMTTRGKLTTLHSFAGGSGDGAHPQGLVNVNGTLYGTTSSGGTHGDGTVFTITPSGTEAVLYNFAGSLAVGGPDGASPMAPPIDVQGTLYGTTASGGKYAKGTVYTMTPSGTETLLYSFQGGTNDGEGPQSALVDGHGILYGTTSSGGSARGGCGTVYAITPAGKESLVSAFQGGGCAPKAAVVDVHGTLYGTTYFGGTNGFGTVFAIKPSGRESVLHSFSGDLADGAYPVAALLYASGTLYGTTWTGGSFNAGTVFALTP